MFKESLKSVKIRINVGKVVKSVGFGTYKEISKIRTAKAIDVVNKTSSIAEGRGTMIIARIPITKMTTPKSLCPRRKFRALPTCCLSCFFFAKNLLEYIGECKFC